jgi:hypothetical protein
MSSGRGGMRSRNVCSATRFPSGSLREDYEKLCERYGRGRVRGMFGGGRDDRVPWMEERDEARKERERGWFVICDFVKMRLRVRRWEKASHED